MTRKLLLAGGIILVLLAPVGGVYLASKQVPTFYKQAVSIDPELLVEQGQQLERNVLELHNDVQRTGLWEATFTQDEVNGWLAVDLPKKFADALPPKVKEPRVAILNQRIKVACRYASSKIDTVVSLSLEARLTDKPNELMVRVHKVRAGMLPIPIKQFLGEISKVAEKAGLNLRWTDEDGDHVALIIIPEEFEGYDQRLIRIETLEVLEGELKVSGQTKPFTKEELSRINKTKLR